jgi:predicted AAA+ superfamily ATPase
MQATAADRNDYTRRTIDNELDALFQELPAIVLDGPKGVGKTTTALQRARTIRRLDRTSELAVVEADPDIISTDEKPVLIDEWQRWPEVFDVVRRLVDQDNSGGQYLMTGSAARQNTHGGAGRITSLRMRPMSFSERDIERPTVSFAELLSGSQGRVAGKTSVGLSTYVDEIIRGGFPGLRHLGIRALQTQLDGYVERIVDHDFQELGYRVRRPVTVTSWLRAYAAATATTATWTSIQKAATRNDETPLQRKTTLGYTDLLKGLRILDPLEPWTTSRNPFVRLGAAEKHHLADPALAARLLNRTRDDLLIGDDGPIRIPNDGSLLGNLFESLVALSIRTFAQSADARCSHLRQHDGRHEIDFIVEYRGKILAIEVKLNSNVDADDVKHLAWLEKELRGDFLDGVVITTGAEAYRRQDGFAVVPLALLGS